MVKRLLMAALLLAVARAASAQDYFPGFTAPTFGSPTVTGQIKNADGTQCLPSYTFNTETDFGFVRRGTTHVDIAKNCKSLFHFMNDTDADPRYFYLESNVNHGVTDLQPTNAVGVLYGGSAGQFGLYGFNGDGTKTSVPLFINTVAYDKAQSGGTGVRIASYAKLGTGIQPIDDGKPLLTVSGFTSFALTSHFEIRGASASLASAKGLAGSFLADALCYQWFTRSRICSTADGTFEFATATGTLGMLLTGDDLTFPSGGTIGLVRAAWSNTAPTNPVACSTPTITWSNGTAAFQVDVGTTCAAVTTLVVTLPALANGYICVATNTTTSTTAEVEMTASTTTTATFTNYTRTTGVALAWVDGADIRIGCTGG